MKTDYDVIRLPLSFPSRPDFKALLERSRDKPAILLGRLLALTLLVDRCELTCWTIAEIDCEVGWPEGIGVPFSELLAAVGWATRAEGSILVDLRLPLQVTNPYRLAGRRRAERARRDASGRYLRPVDTEPSPAPRPQVEIDAEGNEVSHAK